MAAPTYRSSGGSSGATDAGGAWSYSPAAPEAAGRIIIVHFLQDGNTNGAISSVVGTNIENLAGTDNVWTQIPGTNGDGSHPVGNPAAARQFIYIGRSLSTSAPTISGANSTSEDLYFLAAEYSDVNTGTNLSDVIENGTAGSTTNNTGSSATVTAPTVTTLGPDRLAQAFLAVNDDNSLPGLFTGTTGGTWAGQNSYADAAGTDGAVSSLGAAMASAGTITGGTGSIVDIDAWGIVGFALIGTTAAGPPTSLIYQPGIQAAIPRSLYNR